MNWIDILLLIIFLKSAIEGFSKGLILSAFKMAGVIVALYAGVFYRDSVVDFLKNHFAVETALSVMLNVPRVSGTGIEEVGAMGLSRIVDMALGAIGFFIVFAGVQLVFMIPAFFLDSLTRLTNLTAVNRLLGLVFGLARSALWVALIYALLSPFLMAWPAGWVTRGLNGSYILMHLKFMEFITPVVVKLI
ncbi:MAG TPA: CvpA family protein [Thermoanaerobacterales bacterium]|nr:CvpA family protein [Thermoanaerobacterales bacterium]